MLVRHVRSASDRANRLKNHHGTLQIHCVRPQGAAPGSGRGISVGVRRNYFFDGRCSQSFWVSGPGGRLGWAEDARVVVAQTRFLREKFAAGDKEDRNALNISYEKGLLLMMGRAENKLARERVFSFAPLRCSNSHVFVLQYKFTHVHSVYTLQT